MRTKMRAVLVAAAVLATAGIAAGARPRSPLPDAGSSGSHPSGTRRATVARTPVEGPIPAPAAAEPSKHTPGTTAAPDEPDWGNPYDLLIRGIAWGPTRDMR
jgi:hypothetical protein